MGESSSSQNSDILPASLSGGPYKNWPSIHKLSNLAISMRDGAIYTNSEWYAWREVLENIEMAHFAFDYLMNIEERFSSREGRLQGSGQHGPFAKYHSAALVYFSQAAIELAAARLNEQLGLNICQPFDVVFHSPRYKDAANKYPQLLTFLDQHQNIINKIKQYRVAWFHHLSGGANAWSDKSPSSPGFEGMYGAPIDPDINRHLNTDPKKYLEAVNRCRQENDGRWVYPLHEFARLIFDGTESVCFDALDIALQAVTR